MIIDEILQFHKANLGLLIFMPSLVSFIFSVTHHKMKYIGNHFLIFLLKSIGFLRNQWVPRMTIFFEIHKFPQRNIGWSPKSSASFYLLPKVQYSLLKVNYIWGKKINWVHIWWIKWVINLNNNALHLKKTQSGYKVWNLFHWMANSELAEDNKHQCLLFS
jgi:hypothetical protein